MLRVVYSGRLKLLGEEHENTLSAVINYTSALRGLKRFEEAKSLLSKATRIARRALGEDHIRTLELRWSYALALYNDPSATLDDLREAVATLEDAERIARRVLGGAHPITAGMGRGLRDARAALGTNETPGSA